jgi:hypothetical protein
LAAVLPFALPFLAEAGGADAVLAAAPVDRIARGALTEPAVLPVLAPAPAPEIAQPLPTGPDAATAPDVAPPSPTVAADACRRL